MEPWFCLENKYFQFLKMARSRMLWLHFSLHFIHQIQTTLHVGLLRCQSCSEQSLKTIKFIQTARWMSLRHWLNYKTSARNEYSYKLNLLACIYICFQNLYYIMPNLYYISIVCYLLDLDYTLHVGLHRCQCCSEQSLKTIITYFKDYIYIYIYMCMP